MDFNKIEFRDILGNIAPYKEGYDVNFRLGVYVFVFNLKNEILIIKDSKAMGKWEIPGGGLDLNETYEQCGIREVKEETGYDIELISKDLIYFSQKFSYFRTRDTFQNSFYFFLVGKLKSEIRGETNFDLGENIDEYRWVKISDLKKYEVSIFQQKAFEKFIEKYS